MRAAAAAAALLVRAYRHATIDTGAKLLGGPVERGYSGGKGFPNELASILLHLVSFGCCFYQILYSIFDRCGFICYIIV